MEERDELASFRNLPFPGAPAILLGTLSNDNGDGDGNATASGETQKFHCA